VKVWEKVKSLNSLEERREAEAEPGQGEGWGRSFA